MFVSLFFCHNSFSQKKIQIDTNRIYVKIISDFAKQNPSLILFSTVKTYASGGATIGVSDIPLNHSTWFPINCSSNNPITLTVDYAFKNKKPISEIPGNFHRGDSVVVDIDNLTANIFK